ncbi:MAG: thioredoxin [Erysipelotrichaceae bacterium]|nr:thioredoxin [Erysipelotrichaceae bacterium]
MEINITSKEQYLEYVKSPRVLIDFNAKWCGPCRMLSPVLEEIAENDENLVIMKIDTDLLPELAMEYKVSAIPALFFLKNGEVVGSSLGFLPKPQLEKLIKEKLD